jgi:ribose 5-phosphate isomerase B
MKIALGADHRGATLVRDLAASLERLGHEPVFAGQCSTDACDYPDDAFRVGRAVVDGDADRGLLVCGSGVGVAMAANKVPGIRAALVFDPQAAEMSRRHNDANVLCLSADRLDVDQAALCLEAFLVAPFEGGRHARRVAKMTAIERGEDPAQMQYEPANS